MRTSLSLDHLFWLITENRLEGIPELSSAKTMLLKTYDELKKQGAFNPETLTGCTECAKKNFRHKKKVLLINVVVWLNKLKDTGNPLTELRKAISDYEKTEITQLDLVVPILEPAKPSQRQLSASRPTANQTIITKAII